MKGILKKTEETGLMGSETFAFRCALVCPHVPRGIGSTEPFFGLVVGCVWVLAFNRVPVVVLLCVVVSALRGWRDGSET